MLTTPEGEIIFGISDFCQQLKQTVEKQFASVWLVGEISGFTHHQSGHMYFDLKDAQSKVSCAFFRGRNRRCQIALANGQQVIVRGTASIYGARSQYQLIIEQVELYGQGTLQQQFEVLKKQLAAAGIFDPQHKRPIPSWPRCIGVITSSNGAAVHDVLSVLKRRCPMIPVVIYPVPVQGKEAAPAIIRALAAAQATPQCDVLLLTRGGGSLEDLWAFNSEQLAYAIYDCTLPIVSAVGHEVDFTIADFVADQRAPTPSAAAELLSPNQIEVQQQIRQRQHNITGRLQAIIQHKTQQLVLLQAKLKHPAQRLQERGQHCDYLLHRLHVAMQKHLTHHQQACAQYARALQQLSPLNVVARGYAITQKTDGMVITDSQQVSKGDRIEVRLKHGKLDCEVL